MNISPVVTSPRSCTTEAATTSPNPNAVSRSDNSPYPTTFVQADTSNFKQVVQMLTGSSDHQHHKADPGPSPRAAVVPPIRSAPKKQQGFRLYERRNSLKNAFMINTLLPGSSSFASATTPPPAFSPRNLFHHHEVPSPSTLDFPKLTLSSPVTPLNSDPFGKSSPSLGNSSMPSEEERAIADKGFYFHPSPINTPRETEPQLLPLFPVTSPRISGAPS
ncbi:hypothetical protein MLD38_035195 [Melastoma candidum]|uniref:Uncharacterized protein n=1 Tax=Melastoma candidum TaxID=119954 RepID=A0ACB9MCZ5_9MYRT|nr:hypothetical protein MLD38_035195 [Melastoma candidum]